MLLSTYDGVIEQNSLHKVVDELENDGVIIIPTDTFFAFACESPHGCIMERIFSTPSAAIFSGVSAKSKSFGETSLTRLSVHCAESTTATRNVYTLRLRKGICGLG